MERSFTMFHGLIVEPRLNSQQVWKPQDAASRVASCHRELPRSPKDHPALHCDSVLRCSVASRCQWLALVGTVGDQYHLLV